MSSTLDFSGMFKPARQKKEPERFQLGNENEKPQQNAFDQLDSAAFVSKMVNVELKIDELPKAALHAMEKLIHEREYWQSQCVNLTEECNKVKGKLESSTREKERESVSAEALRREIQNLNARISSMTNEQREVKNRWLAEKNDLETRFFQIQGLNTQMQGVTKKKEKDYEKLQAQLSKMVKDAVKAQKAPCIQLSQPLKKNLSQEDCNRSSTALLRDAELSAAKNTIHTLDGENKTLRQALEDLKGSMQELHDKFETSLHLAEAKNQFELQRIVEEHQNELSAKEDMLQELKLAQANAAVMKVSITMPTPKKESDFNEAAARSKILKLSTATKKCLEGTPLARPVGWVIDQANTEVKRLRDRADQIGGSRGDPSEDLYADSEAFIRLKFNTLKAQLSEALNVIQEQDKLIHEALLAKLPGLAPTLLPEFWEVNENEEIDGQVSAEGLKSVRKEQASRFDFTGFKFKNSDFLPPASPETLALLETYGWDSVPRLLQSNSRRTSMNKKRESIENREEVHGYQLEFE